MGSRTEPIYFETHVKVCQRGDLQLPSNNEQFSCLDQHVVTHVTN